MASFGKLGAMQQMIKDRIMPASAVSDDNILVKKIVSDHNPDGLEYDVKPLLHIVEDILRRSTLSSEGASTGALAHVDHVEDKSHLPGYTNMLEALSFKIDCISCEISYKTLGGADAHTTTVAIFEMLTTYKWDVKLVLALAAFALTYGEFWLLAHIHDTNQLAKSMAILKQLPSIMEHAGSMKPRFDALNDLIKVVLEVTRCVIEFNDIPTRYIAQEVPPYTTASNQIPIAVYWSVRSIVACAAQITSLTTLGYEIMTSTNDTWELSTLAHKLKNIANHLREQLHNCYKHIERKMDSEAYEMLHDLFSTPHLDNMKVLKALIYAKDDILPLYDGSSKKRVGLEPLRKRNVLLLISGLEFSHDELLILEQIYNESKGHASRMDSRYELVWIPIMDQSSEWTEAKQRVFESLQETTPWFSVYHPSLISKAVTWFIQREWKYKNKPIIVVLDPYGRVACPNAIHMMWIWGSAAFPFTSSREKDLWKEETWRLELLVDGIDSEILNWIKEGKYIFFYGGDDHEWVRRFVKEARRIAQATLIPLEMVYVGKGNKREQVQKVWDTILREKLNTHSWQEHSMVWFFWTRLQSMLFSKIQLGQADEEDLVMQEIKKLLSYDRQGGWIILARGSQIVVNGHATTGLQTLMEYDTIWKEFAERDGFEPSFKDQYEKNHRVANPCCRFEFSHAMGRIPDKLTCPECRRHMHVLTTFECCHDENNDEDFFIRAVAPPTI
ncbi:protein SIEVE ELEMENT OCCLUSION B [Gastrolobium bilobum]|uniref:protein SIEVE ELEMENT OCCLUSION B n=1 Tax=Gastrolobium bilobum TaxID=150636 RepID=UPI002AB2E76D|nr:protein SIEVE ELEMENT OCCLUSION B [Gastrolobium bilobum]XP_061341851.1 protein SIEVE ELEMENT OCCLUSION B [Gastrolobium bilobum]XP_061341852.1 protein SIEVE ELEMENT OCCLUSION B [Gastrolobium bilobum]XP_061341853.1 protein SIEVE ELEMENT OCCLUSION B [Gastrolobium bilobum]